jgi:hypothetical protein
MDNFTYKDGTIYTVEIDLPNRDIYIRRTKAGNVRTWVLKQYGVGLIRDELVVNLSEQLLDSEGDPIPIPPQRLDIVFRDQEYFNDLNDYSLNGAVPFAKLFVDMIIKQRLEQTRIYAPDGTFVAPAYFELSGTDPTTPGASDGSITATVLQANGYTDLQVRLRQNGGAWGAWAAITDELTVANRTAGTYDVEMRSLGTSLLITPVETVFLVDPVVE